MLLIKKTGKKQSQKRLDKIIFSLEQKDFTKVTIKHNIAKKVWVAKSRNQRSGSSKPSSTKKPPREANDTIFKASLQIIISNF